MHVHGIIANRNAQPFRVDIVTMPLLALVLPLNWPIHEHQKFSSNLASADKLNHWHHATLAFRVTYKLRVIKQVTIPKAIDIEATYPNMLTKSLARIRGLLLAICNLSHRATILLCGTLN